MFTIHRSQNGASWWGLGWLAYIGTQVEREWEKMEKNGWRLIKTHKHMKGELILELYIYWSIFSLSLSGPLTCTSPSIHIITCITCITRLPWQQITYGSCIQCHNHGGVSALYSPHINLTYVAKQVTCHVSLIMMMKSAAALNLALKALYMILYLLQKRHDDEIVFVTCFASLHPLFGMISANIHRIKQSCLFWQKILSENNMPY